MGRVVCVNRNLHWLLNFQDALLMHHHPEICGQIFYLDPTTPTWVYCTVPPSKQYLTEGMGIGPVTSHGDGWLLAKLVVGLLITASFLGWNPAIPQKL